MFPRNLPTGFDKQSRRWTESLGTRRFCIFLSLYQWQDHWHPHSSWPGRCEAGTCASSWEWPETAVKMIKILISEQQTEINVSFIGVCLIFRPRPCPDVVCVCFPPWLVSVRSLVAPPVSNSASVGSVVTCYGLGYWCQKSRLMRPLSCLTGRRGMPGMSHDVGDLRSRSQAVSELPEKLDTCPNIILSLVWHCVSLSIFVSCASPLSKLPYHSISWWSTAFLQPVPSSSLPLSKLILTL